MTNITKLKMLSLIGTIESIILLVLALCGIVLAASGLVPVEELFNSSTDVISNASSHDVTGGFEVLGGFGGMMLAFVGMLALFVVLTLGGTLTLLSAPSVVTGVKLLRNLKRDAGCVGRLGSADSICKIFAQSLLSIGTLSLDATLLSAVSWDLLLAVGAVFYTLFRLGMLSICIYELKVSRLLKLSVEESEVVAE